MEFSNTNNKIINKIINKTINKIMAVAAPLLLILSEPSDSVVALYSRALYSSFGMFPNSLMGLYQSCF